MLKKDFWYDLPKELIAQEPANPRDSARLMVLRRSDDSMSTGFFMICRIIWRQGRTVINNPRSCRPV